MNVELNDGAIIDLARWDVVFPLHDPRYANAAFPRLRFEAAQRAVARCDLCRRAAVVADENDKCFLPARARGFSRAPAHRVVHGGSIAAKVRRRVVLDLREAREVFSRIPAARGRR